MAQYFGVDLLVTALAHLHVRNLARRFDYRAMIRFAANDNIFGPALIGPTGTDEARERQVVVASTPLCVGRGEEITDQEAKLPSPRVGACIFDKKNDHRPYAEMCHTCRS
jgi:hypothetical protein